MDFMINVAMDDDDQIARVFTMLDGHQVIVLRDGTAIRLSDSDVETLELAFESACENCGFDPTADPFEDSADEDSSDSADEEEEEDDGVGYTRGG